MNECLVCEQQSMLVTSSESAEKVGSVDEGSPEFCKLRGPGEAVLDNGRFLGDETGIPKMKI